MKNISNIFLKIGKWNLYNYEKFDKRTNKNYYSSTICTTNKFLYKFLENNDYKQKSYISADKILNKIPDKLKHHFFRGYSDADGCYYYNTKTTTKQYSITSTKEQNWSFMINIFEKLNIKYSLRILKTYSQIRIVNKSDILKYAEYLYQDSINIRLERKYEKYIFIKNCKIPESRWTIKDEQFLIENYDTKGIDYCVEKLNRTIKSIKFKIYTLRKQNKF